jgi:hypothetical protein
MEAEVHVAFIFKISEIEVLSFKKSEKKIQNVDNDEIYKRVKSQYEILCILDYIKIKKSDRFYRFELCTIHYSKIHTFVIFV